MTETRTIIYETGESGVLTVAKLRAAIVDMPNGATVRVEVGSQYNEDWWRVVGTHRAST